MQIKFLVVSTAIAEGPAALVPMPALGGQQEDPGFLVTLRAVAPEKDDLLYTAVRDQLLRASNNLMIQVPSLNGFEPGEEIDLPLPA